MKNQKPYLEFAIKTYLNSKNTIIDENIQVIKEHMLDLASLHVVDDFYLCAWHVCRVHIYFS